MAISEKVSVRDIVVAVVLIVIFVVAMLVVRSIYRTEGEKRSAEISSLGEKDPNHIVAAVKLLSIDPVKGDIQARIEFFPEGNLAKPDGTLARDLKLFVNSANGKQELEFAKNKRMNPIDTTISLFDGLATDYPFDKHSAFLELYLTTVPDKKTDAAKPAPGAEPAATPAATPEATPAAPPADGSTPAAEPKPAEPARPEAEEDDNEVSLSVDFFGSLPGYKIEASRSKESSDDYVGIDMKIARSSTVIFFSGFVMFLMWGATIAVLLLVLSVVLHGRKVEVSMFSFLAALIFALIAVRNAQPGIPPIGTLSDFVAFFWAEVILALCLLTIIFVWLFRPAAK